MISRFITYLRGNAIAFAALFIALGGTSYAAVSLPRNSVGTPQLRNGAVTSSKLAGALGAQVWSVAQVSSFNGFAISYPKGLRPKYWQQTSTGAEGFLVYPHPFPKECIPVATAVGPQTLLNPEFTPSVSATRAGNSQVQIYTDGANGFNLVIVCPRGT